MIEFSCHTWAFSDLTLPEALGTIARLGFRWVDIGSGANFNAPRAAANPRQVAAQILEDLHTFNLKLADLYLMLPWISAADSEKRQKDLDLFRALIPFATALQTPGITLSPGLAAPDGDPDAFTRAMTALREMARIGGEAGLRVSIEPHLDSIAPDPGRALQMLHAVPGLQITLDWAHLVCQGVEQPDLLLLMPFLRHVQVRQAAKKQLQTTYEKGRIDPEEVIDMLRSFHYDGRICVEYMNTAGWHGMASVNAIRESARMRDALRQARDQQQS